ncbi:MAG: AMP-binding protein, partial [Gammaproteobacteria bacterium]
MKKIWHHSYDPGMPTSITYPEVSIKELFNRTAERCADRVYLIHDERRLSYGEFNTLARKFAQGLRSIGVQKADRVVLISPNTPEYLIARHACYKIGAIVVPINPHASLREMTHFFADSQAETVVVAASFAERPMEILGSGCTPLRRIIVFPDPVKPEADVHQPGVINFQEVFGFGSDQEPLVDVLPEDIAVLQYTGGTTGLSKACVLTHRNHVTMACQSAEWMKPLVSGETMKTLAALPLYHVYGFNMNVNLNLVTGGSMILLTQPNTDNLLNAINRHEPNFFAAVPTMLLGLNQHPDLAQSKINSIRIVFSGGAPLAGQVMESFEKRSGARITEGYGLSEITCIVTGNPVQSRRKIGSIGVPFPDVDLKIVDRETGTRDLSIGEPGEIVLKTPTMMREYWNKPDETREAIRDGWLHTGDIGKIDEDGFVFIVDRKKDMILVKGFNVYPREIDEVLFSHPKIASALTIGIPDEKCGEVVKVYVVVESGQTLSKQEVIDFCAEQ